MNPELLISLAAFSFVSSITPGPNNLMLMASGANFGLLRTMPHLMGVAIGFVIMTLVVGAGLAQIFDRYPVSYNVLKVVSVVYLLFLAWKIANAAPVRLGRLAVQPGTPEPGSGAGTPISFLQAILFQWVNPKAWAMALTALSVYNPSRSLAGVVLVATVFGLINLPCVSSWMILGQQIRRVLNNHLRLRLFNWTMAVMLVLSLAPVLSL
jgi:threonine/homoserine/homoserine lactone efflux protein